MAWFSRITRFGDMHLVYGQEANMSCGIASVLMCVFKINKLAPGKQAVHVEKKIYDVYSKASGGKYQPETRGTRPEHLVTVLDGLDCGEWTWSRVAGAAATDFVMKRVPTITGFGPTFLARPIIIGVDWDGGGAHWIVVDTIRFALGKKYATICDPWDADVHVQGIQPGTPFTYDTNTAGISVDLWGTHKEYSGPSVGRVKTWGIIHQK